MSQILDIKNSTGKIKKKIQIYKIKAPVKKGQCVGKILYMRGNKVIKTEEINAERAIKKADFLSQMKKICLRYFQI